MTNQFKREVLIIEDNPYDAELAKRVLNKARPSINIQLLMDGDDVWDFFFKGTDEDVYMRSKEINLVLLDLKMPKISGLEILKKLKSNPMTASIPVVILSSSREPKDIQEAYRLGTNGYVVKPVDFGEYSKTLESINQFWIDINETTM
ncbi:MAG TPA: two-component system response regulator [Prolixibacteraceae bacterium]|nr:two-component system response regulator [Prolixibacteraceae bacterium]